MRGYFYLLGKEIKLMLKNKSFYIWVLFLPILFLLIFSRIGKGDSASKVILIDNVKSKITKEFKERLSRDFKVIKDVSKREKYPLIELSGDFLLKTKSGSRVKVTFPEDLSEDKKIYLKIAIYKVMAELTAKYRLGINNVKTFVDIKTKKEKLLEIPWGIRHTLPAIILMFILFNVLTKGVEKFFEYKEQGLIERFSVLPSGVRGVLSFFILYQVTLAMLSVTIIFLVGVFFFNFSISVKSIFYLYIILLVFSVLISSISLLVFSLIKRKEAAIGFGVLIANVLCALGGLWWPLEIVPPFFRKLGLILPTGFPMKLIDGIIYYNLPLSSVVFQFLIMFFFSVILILLSYNVFVKKSL